MEWCCFDDRTIARRGCATREEGERERQRYCIRIKLIVWRVVPVAVLAAVNEQKENVSLRAIRASDILYNWARTSGSCKRESDSGQPLAGAMTTL